MDYNINKKVNGNRFLVGVRYGFSRYNYDFQAPDFSDPVYGIASPMKLEGLKGNNQWLELCLGFETRLWSIVRLGWNIRYKTRTLQSVSELGEPYFVPGFGKNDNNTFGGSVYVTFDVGKSANTKGLKSLFRKHKNKEENFNNETETPSENTAPRAAKSRGN